MKHEVFGSHLGRNKNQRSALFKSLIRSLILRESISTTNSKAKAIKGLVDKIINAAKTPTTRRLVSQFLDKATSERLIKELTPRLKERNSGYTSVVRIGKRLGDGAMMVKMSLILGDSDRQRRVSKEEKSTATSSGRIKRILKKSIGKEKEKK